LLIDLLLISEEQKKLRADQLTIEEQAIEGTNLMKESIDKRLN
jgi:hypothetical protein